MWAQISVARLHKAAVLLQPVGVCWPSPRTEN